MNINIEKEYKNFRECVKPLHKKGYLFEVIKEFIAYKKCYSIGYGGSSIIATLTIPVGARVVWANIGTAKTILGYSFPGENFKIRTDKAIVTDLSREFKKVRSDYDYDFVYEKGKIVVPKFKFHNGPVTCRSGIHFFLHEQLAQNYI
jgi:hypothetical protein